MKTLNFNPVAIFQILQEGESPSRLEHRACQLRDHYTQGYDRYCKTVSKEDRFDYQDTLTFLERLCTLTQEFTHLDNDVSLILKRENQQINVMPLTRFFDEYDPEQCLAILDSIETALVEYIHGDNCVDFKSAFQTITRWRYVFRDIQPDC